MLRLLGKHPYLSLAILLLIQAAAVTAAMVVIAVCRDPWDSAPWSDYVIPLWHAALLMLPFVCGFIVGLIRRRSGCSPWFLLLASGPMAVLACLPVCVIGSLTACVISWDGAIGPDGPEGGREVYSFADLLGWYPREGFHITVLVLAAVGAALGVLAGWAVAAWLIRSGRWETIVPVQQRATNSAAPPGSGDSQS